MLRRRFFDLGAHGVADPHAAHPGDLQVIESKLAGVFDGGNGLIKEMLMKGARQSPAGENRLDNGRGVAYAPRLWRCEDASVPSFGKGAEGLYGLPKDIICSGSLFVFHRHKNQFGQASSRGDKGVRFQGFLFPSPFSARAGLLQLDPGQAVVNAAQASLDRAKSRGGNRLEAHDAGQTPISI